IDELKKRLVNEYGGSVSSFIIKSIEPMISQARRLIEDLSNPNQKSEGFQDLLQQAVISVELYSQFSDETKLIRKIIQEAHQFTRNSIDKDIEVLANYKRQALEDSSLSSGEKEEQSSKLALFLDPVINELRGI